MQGSVFHDHARVRRHDVDVVGLQGEPFRRLEYRHGAGARQQRCQGALVGRVEVLDHHEGHAEIARQVAQQPAHRLEAPG
jgi:hypothetical protein